MSQDQPCPYQVLGVERSADAATIKSAFRKLAMEHHPDRVRGAANQAGKTEAQLKAAAEAAEAGAKRINTAYDILKDPQKRAAYDRLGHGAFSKGAGSSYRPGSGPASGFRGAGGAHDPFADIFRKAGVNDKEFEDWFRRGFGARPGSGPQQRQQQQKPNGEAHRPHSEQPRGERPNASSHGNARSSWQNDFNRSRSSQTPPPPPPRSSSHFSSSNSEHTIFHNEHGKISFGRVALVMAGAAAVAYVVHKLATDEQKNERQTQANFNNLADMINRSVNQGVGGL